MDFAVRAMEECADFNRLADLHDRRRGEGMPTLSTLVGDVPLAQHLWRMWAVRRARRTAVVAGGTVEDWFREWVHNVLSGRDLYLDAERYLRQRLPEPLNMSRDYLRDKTQHELGLAFEHASLESFVKAVVREHIIHVRGWTADRVRQAVAARTSRAIDVPDQVFAEVARLGASPALVDSLCAASIVDRSGRCGLIEGSGGDNASEVSSELSRDERDPWKSAQERFLFQLLEHTADLTGRFQLNAEPGFPFGNQPAAVDLLNSQLKIAVEIDGYHHFTSADRYRRDRRKDYALQQHGFLVLRFLAEDVVPRMQTVLQAIREAVHLRESQRST